MCSNLKLEIKYEYNWNQIRNIISLLISYIFLFFMGSGCNIQYARLVLLKCGPQQITSAHKLMEDHVRKAMAFRYDAVMESELLTVSEQENSNLQMPFKDN